MTNKEKLIKNLSSLITRYQASYYNGTAEVSDAEFDVLWDELKALDPGNKIFDEVGVDKSERFKKRAHIMPMGSQNKVSDEESFLEWAKGKNVRNFVVEAKLDGASLELQYREGRLIAAVTRGDGLSGDDVTSNVLEMEDVIEELEIPFSGAIRGEVILLRDVFQRKYQNKANCRNAASGILRRKDGKGSRDLTFIAYDIYDPQKTIAKSPTTELQKLAILDQLFFRTVKHTHCKNTKEVLERYYAYLEERKYLPYDIDGLVIKNNLCSPTDLFNVRPEYQIAYKFEPEEVISLVKDVVWNQEGATLTPVAVMTPVMIAGSTVSKANLVNPNTIANLGLKIGSTVVVSRRGDIIPKIERVSSNSGAIGDVRIPKYCTGCGGELKNIGTRLYCPSVDCPSRALHRLKKWVKTLSIYGFGEHILEELFESLNVWNISDLYKISEARLCSITGVGLVLAAKLYRELHRKRTISLEKFVAGFDIEDIGETQMTKVINAGFDTIIKLYSATCADFAKIPGFALTLATHLVEGLKENQTDMNAVIATGTMSVVSLPEDDSVSNEGDRPLAGLSFCFTGGLYTMTRKEVYEKVKELGGTVKTTVGRGLNYLVTNSPDTTTKLSRARELDILIINEKAFLNMF